jgi:hypothetical protein
MFRPFVAFETIQSRPDVRVLMNTGEVIKCTWRNSVYGGNFEIMAITDIYKSLSLFILYQRARSPEHQLGQVVTKINVFLLFRYELENHYDGLLPLEGKKMLGISEEVCFCVQPLPKAFL